MSPERHGPLHELYRPKSWSEVVGQDKVIAKIDRLRQRGLSGRAYWIVGSTGTGKTTIAKLLAKEVADDDAIEDLDIPSLTAARVRKIGETLQQKLLSGRGRAFLTTGCRGLQRDAVLALIGLLDRLPGDCVFVFTTTHSERDSFVRGNEDAQSLLSRCHNLELSRRDLSRPFAERAQWIALQEGLSESPIEKFVRLAQDNHNDLRAMINDIASGKLLGDTSAGLNSRNNEPSSEA